MLDVALKFLEGELNTYLLTQSGSSSVKVELSKLVDETGKYGFETGDVGTIGVSIINVEEDRIFKSQAPERTFVGGQQIVIEPELKLNLHVIFAANFKKYDQALKYISYILTYFQSHPVFSATEYPALDPRIEKLTTELQSLNYEQLNQVWAFIGGKQLPSVIYKIRMIALQDISATTIQRSLLEINTNIYQQ
jgi:hypothetical protein